MATEQTFAIIKPDAVKSGYSGKIIDQIEANGFTIKCLKKVHLTKAQAEGFYYVHRERGFFGELVDFMSRGPVIITVLEREDAIAKYREVIGATDPAKADAGTVRKLYGANVGENAVHGSDKPESAAREIAYFFAGYEAAPTA